MQAKGYYEEDFTEVFARYMSPSDMEKVATIERSLPPPDSGTDPEVQALGAEGEADSPGQNAPSCDFGATGPPSPGLDATTPPSPGSGATNQKKDDDSDAAQGGKAAAA